MDLSSDRDVWVYTSSTAPMPIIRNEELILIYAEANIQTNNFTEAVKALNVIREKHDLADYSGALTQPALINEMLYERRYSLFFEGHRWIDVRRYNLLNTLPIRPSRRQCVGSVPVTGFGTIKFLVVNDEAAQRNLGSLFLLFLMMVMGIIFLAFFNIHMTVDTMRLPINGGRILDYERKICTPHTAGYLFSLLPISM